MNDDEIMEEKEIRDCIIAKFPISSFGKLSEKIKDNYPTAKLLVFMTEPWKLTGV